MDERGRVWFTARVRHPNNPDFCKKGSSHPSAKAYPINRAGRHLSMYDPATGKWALISTCFATHHLIFAEDANHTIWTSASGGGEGAIGWLNRKLYDETGDEQRAQGWTPFILAGVPVPRLRAALRSAPEPTTHPVLCAAPSSTDRSTPAGRVSLSTPQQALQRTKMSVRQLLSIRQAVTSKVFDI
jgi:hypothetical protein